MPRLRLLRIGFACLSALAVGVSAEGSAPAFKAGFAERDVSPAVGSEQPGGYGKAYHRAFHDPCKVRAAVFDDGSTRVALVGVDALVVRKATVAAAREAIRERCGIAPGSVLVSASHTHSGGATGMFLPDEFDGASPLVRKLVRDHTVSADAAYLARVERAIADAVCAADAGRVEARCAAGFGVEDKVAFNRRFRMKNGLTYTHPGVGNPEIVDAAGPTDPQVGVLGCWARDGKFLGCVVNFACHATTGPGGISADYVYYLEKAVRGLMGENAVVVFLPGAGGDVTQVDNRNPYQTPQFGEASARFVGGRLGAEAVKTLLTLEPGAGPLGPLAARSRTLAIARRSPSPERLARAREAVAADPQRADPTAWTFAKELVLLEARIAREPVPDIEVQAIQVGPAVFLACPAEYFCRFGLDLKAGSKFPFTFPVSMANDCVGYVPTEDAFGPGGGGYETRLTSYSNLEPKAGRTIADALIGLAGGLKPGTTPAPAPAAKFSGKPWAYGSVAPEVD